MRPTRRQIANLLFLPAVLVVNGLAAAGTLSGASIGDLANRHPSWFLPADWTFSIWSLIYLALGAFVVHQVRPSRREDPVLEALGPWWMVSCALNMAWIVAFSFRWFGTALLVMVALLATLVAVRKRIEPRGLAADRATRLFVVYPFRLYLAWISLAVVANTFHWLSSAGWGLDGTGSLPAALVALVGSGGVALVLAMRGRDWIFPSVAAWTFLGIADRFPDVATLSGTGWILAGVMVLVAALSGLQEVRRPVRIDTFLFGLLFLAVQGCAGEPRVPLDSLVVRDSTYLVAETGEPYTGEVFRAFSDDPDHIQLEGRIEEGSWNGEMTVYHEGGGIRYQGRMAGGAPCGAWVENRSEEAAPSLYESLVQDVESMGLYPPCPD
jgi:hypothetical protein